MISSVITPFALMIQQVCSADYDEFQVLVVSLSLSAECKAEFEESNYIAYEGVDDAVRVCVSLTCDYSSDARVEVFADKYYEAGFIASEGICTAIISGYFLWFNSHISLASRASPPSDLNGQFFYYL